MNAINAGHNQLIAHTVCKLISTKIIYHFPSQRGCGPIGTGMLIRQLADKLTQIPSFFSGIHLKMLNNRKKIAFGISLRMRILA